MRQETRLEWEILEAEEDEWEEVTTSVTAGRHSTAHRQRLTAVLSAVALSIALAGPIVYLLWQEAEAGIAATEHHIGTLVEVETLREQASNHTVGSQAEVASIALHANAAMVRVAMTATSPTGQVLPYDEIRFYRQRAAGWERTQPILAFWGDRSSLDTATIHFDFYELDRPYVETIAGSSDDLHRALRELLGLPPLTDMGRLTVTVAPQYATSDDVVPAATIVVMSPILLRTPATSDRAATLASQLQSQLITYSIVESQRYYLVRPAWSAVMKYLAHWLYGHADELPALVSGTLPAGGSTVSPPNADMLESLIIDNVADYYHSPGYAEYRNQATARSAIAFFDWLVATRGPDALPALLQAFGTQDSWPALVDEAFGLSIDELLAQWETYEVGSQQNESSGG